MQKIKAEYTHDNSVARITLDDGKGNVLDSVMMGELNELLNSFKDKPELKLITFEGAGKHFCFDLTIGDYLFHFYSLLKPMMIIVVKSGIEYNEQANGLKQK